MSCVWKSLWWELISFVYQSAAPECCCCSCSEGMLISACVIQEEEKGVWWIPVQASGITGEGIWALDNGLRLVWIVVGILWPLKTTLTWGVLLFCFYFLVQRPWIFTGCKWVINGEHTTSFPRRFPTCSIGLELFINLLLVHRAVQCLEI